MKAMWMCSLCQDILENCIHPSHDDVRWWNAYLRGEMNDLVIVTLALGYCWLCNSQSEGGSLLPDREAAESKTTNKGGDCYMFLSVCFGLEMWWFSRLSC